MRMLGIFLNNEMRTGGHVRYLELMEELAKRGNRIVVLLNSFLGYQPSYFGELSYPVKYRRKSFPPVSWVFRLATAQHKEELGRSLGKPDAILVHGETHLSAGAGLARAFKAPLVYGHRSNSVRETLTYMSEHRHGTWARALFRIDLFRRLCDERRIARLADLIVFQSPFDQDDFVSRVPLASGKAVVIRGNILGPRFQREYSKVNRSKALHKVVFMGTLGPRKGVDYLIDAIILLASRGIEHLSFDICGPGDRREELKGRLERAGVGNEVTFPGRVADSLPVIAAGDLLIVPSLFDSYPDTILEALHVGRQ